jgi:lipoprotein-anchoring transpeptidase ErfK/SrfK
MAIVRDLLVSNSFSCSAKLDGSIMIGKNEALSHSFMCLSFVTAALLAAVQLSRLLSPPKQAPSSPSFPSSFITVSDSTATGAAIDAASIQVPTVLSRSGLSIHLQTSLNPNPLARRSGLIIDLSDRQLSLFQDGVQIANYEVAIGQSGWETPTGPFKVITMQPNPIWQHPFTGEIFPAGADNPLGSRWIGFWTDGRHQIGLHGTNQDNLIGQAVSHGCVRMRDADVQALYEQVAIGTSILIRP